MKFTIPVTLTSVDSPQSLIERLPLKGVLRVEDTTMSGVPLPGKVWFTPDTQEAIPLRIEGAVWTVVQARSVSAVYAPNRGRLAEADRYEVTSMSAISQGDGETNDRHLIKLARLGVLSMIDSEYLPEPTGHRPDELYLAGAYELDVRLTTQVNQLLISGELALAPKEDRSVLIQILAVTS